MEQNIDSLAENGSPRGTFDLFWRAEPNKHEQYRRSLYPKRSKEEYSYGNALPLSGLCIDPPANWERHLCTKGDKTLEEVESGVPINSISQSCNMVIIRIACHVCNWPACPAT